MKRVNKPGKFCLCFRIKVTFLQKVSISFNYFNRDFTYYKVSEWKLIIKSSLHLIFALQIYASVGSLEEKEGFLGLICAFQ